MCVVAGFSLALLFTGLPDAGHARFVQGAAAAAMMPSSMALTGQAYPDRVKRARAVEDYADRTSAQLAWWNAITLSSVSTTTWAGARMW